MNSKKKDKWQNPSSAPAIQKEPAKPEYKAARVEKVAPEFESETNYESVMGLV